MADSGERSGDASSDGTSCSSGISSQEKDLAKKALDAFEVGQYDSCLAQLSSLGELRRDDHKVQLNRSVAEFYRSGQTATDDLRHSLAQVRMQVHSTAEEMDGLEDVENGTLLYNQAVLLCHFKQYHQAIGVVERLYQFIEPFEERFARAVSFLLMDLYLVTHQAEKALPLLAVLEKLSSQGSGANANGKAVEVAKDAGSHKPDTSSNEQTRSKIHQYKVRAYLQMRSLKACKREIKSVMNTSGNSIPSLFLKSNFEYLRGNYRKAVKLLNSANITEHPGFIKTGECVRCMFWNNLGCIHHAMGKHHMAMFYFKRALQENDNTCAQLLKQVGPSGKRLSGPPLCTLMADRRYELLYNCGILLLQTGRPLAAFDCLVEAVTAHHSNPRLWLRLAECCIAVGKRNSEQEAKSLQNKKGIVHSMMGQGCHRKIILVSHSTQNSVCSPDGQSAAIPVASVEFAGICLRNALLLLLPDEHREGRGTLAGDLGGLGAPEGGGSDSSEGASKSHEVELSRSAPPSSPLKRQEVENLRCSVLACSAYVALALGDNLIALKHAQKLLQQPKLSGSLKFLGHLYAAEALISLDRISDAIAHLNPENVTDVSLGIPTTELEQGGDKGENEPMENNGKLAPLCYPSSVSAARATMLFNLGSAYCLRSEYDKARRCLQQATLLIPPREVPPEAILLAVYLELQNGNARRLGGVGGARPPSLPLNTFLALKTIRFTEFATRITNNAHHADPYFGCISQLCSIHFKLC
ncbi:CCR4-NOT transcription complex subunit 10 isoform X1 [Lampetra fluviatilis]